MIASYYEQGDLYFPVILHNDGHEELLKDAPTVFWEVAVMIARDTINNRMNWKKQQEKKNA